MNKQHGTENRSTNASEGPTTDDRMSMIDMTDRLEKEISDRTSLNMEDHCPFINHLVSHPT